MQDRLYSFPALQSQKAQNTRKLKPAALSCSMLQNEIKSQMSLYTPLLLLKLNYFFLNSHVVATLPTSPKAKQLCHNRSILFTQKKNPLMKNYVGG